MDSDFRDEATVLKIVGEQFELPTTYLIIDTETTGFSRTNDFIIDVGWAVAVNKELVNQNSLLLDWSRMPNVDHSLIKSKLQHQAAVYAEMGRPHYYPWERLCDEGEHPLEVLHAFASLIYEHIKRDDSRIVGHGVWHFDRSVIDSHTLRFLSGWQAPWRQNTIFDTGLLEKAAQTARMPYSNETLEQWQKRVCYSRQTVKYNLENHCAPKYRLIERYGGDMASMHTAGFDCLLIHRLYETFRELIEILNGQRQTLTDLGSVGSSG